MEKRVIKKLLVVLMIITILATDFFVLGSSLITYAAQINNETNNSNIEFSAYFKNGTKRVDSTEKSIKSEDLKLYAEIKVKNEGYFNGTIEIQNSNFNIISSNIGSIEGNKVQLNQINAGESLEVELGIKPVITDKLSTEMLAKTSTIKLTGTYKYSQAEEGENILAEKLVCVNYQPDESAGVEFITDIITNTVLSVNGTNKRIVQLLIKSRLTENQYPVKQTKLNVNIPQLSEKQPEQVDVLAIGELATNGKTELSTDNWKVEDGVVQINLNNEADSNNQISWSKNVYDELVVTLIYSEDVDASKVEIISNSEITTHNVTKTYTATHTKSIENEEPNNVIMGKTQITTGEMYKGQIYANLDTQYNTETTLIVTNENVSDKIVINEGLDTFKTEEAKLNINTKYLSTEINKEKMLEILGQDGNITIKNGTTTIIINRDTQVNENGNIVINYENSASVLEIETSKPVKAGVLEIKHTKIITGNSYTRTELQQVKTLETKNVTLATLAETKILENLTEASLELKETTTKAELTVNKENLSTTVTNESVILGVKLITDGPQYDLYKNPTIKLQLPASVESIKVNSTDRLYADEFGKPEASYDENTKTIKISLDGEQKTYPASSATQLYLQLNLDITLSKLAASKTDKIKMTYVNENATQYFGGTTDVGIIEKEIGIEAPVGLIKYFNLSSNPNTSLTETFTQQVLIQDAGKELNFEVAVVNNTESNMNNVKILGKLPTTRDEENTLETVLKGINTSSGTVYYTENANATADINKSTNRWTTNLTELTNAKLYLIEVGSLNKGSNYTAVVKTLISDDVQQKTTSYADYEVIYDTDYNTNLTQTSRTIGVNAVSILEASLTGQVGQDVLENGDIVKEGEVIKYTATVKNNGTQTLENVVLKADVPEGTVVVEPIRGEYTLEDGTVVNGYVYIPNKYYEEKTEIKEITETIPTLAVGETYTKQYEVRVNTNITSGAEILNKATSTCDDLTVKSDELKNVLQESNIRVTIKRALDESIKLIAGSRIEYDVIIENLTDKKITGLEMGVQSNDIKLNFVMSENTYLVGDDIPEKIVIDEIDANGIINYEIVGVINENVETVCTSVVLTDINNNEFKSNLLIEELPYADATITLSSPQNNMQIKQGDVVEYKIIAKNTGNIEGVINIIDNISEYLTVQEVSKNGELVMVHKDETDGTINLKPIGNAIVEQQLLGVGESVQLDIIAKVLYIPLEVDGMKITNKAEVKFQGVLKNSSEEITHTLQTSEVIVEDLKNIISGFAWIDENENGQRDSSEKHLSGITAKLYDTSTKSYVKDDNGQIIKAVTNEIGKYEFTKIKNGSYQIVFEYDEEKYTLTKYCAESVNIINSSRVKLQNITIDGTITDVSGTDTIDIQDNIEYINIGLKERIIITDDGYTNKEIRGLAWLDENKNGQKDDDEFGISGIKVKIYDVSTKTYLKYTDGNIIEDTTGNSGEYSFTNIKSGMYKIVFEYDTENYELTKYFAEGSDTAMNSKALLQEIEVDGQIITVAATDILELQEDVITDINIGLKNIEDNDNNDDGNNDDNQDDNNQGDDNQDDNNQDDDNNDDKPDDGDGNENIEKPEEKKTISGFAWLDADRDGQKDGNEKMLSGIKVRLYDLSTKNYLKDEKGNIVETTTNDNGEYIFENIEKGEYIILFEYNMEEYEPTIYMAQGVDTTVNSKVVLKKIDINGEEKTFAVTDTIKLNDNISNINIGLKEILIFDLELDKYISRIVVQNSKGTKAYDYEDSTFEKVEIHRKQVNSSLVVFEYTIKVKNNGEMTGYVKNIVDYLPNGLTFSSELNTDWYLSGNYLYTKSLENVELKPGEEKQIKLILTKTMTNENLGLINNRAEIYQDYNQYGDIDIDSTPNNQVQDEDDFGSVDVIIGVSTGGSTIAYIILLMINMILIGIAIKLMIRNNIIKISTKRERR